jgi:hypothetical protein
LFTLLFMLFPRILLAVASSLVLTGMVAAVTPRPDLLFIVSE